MVTKRSRSSSVPTLTLPVVPAKKSSPRPKTSTGDPLAQLTASVGRSLSAPSLLVAMGFVVILVVTHVQDPAKGAAKMLEDTLRRHEGLTGIADWVQKNAVQTVGMMCYVATALTVAPPSKRVGWAALGALLAYLIPEPEVYQYVYQCLAFALYLRTKNRDNRMLIMASVGALYFLGFLSVKAPAAEATLLRPPRQLEAIPAFLHTVANHSRDYLNAPTWFRRVRSPDLGPYDWDPTNETRWALHQ